MCDVCMRTLNSRMSCMNCIHTCTCMMQPRVISSAPKWSIVVRTYWRGWCDFTKSRQYTRLGYTQATSTYKAVHVRRTSPKGGLSHPHEILGDAAPVVPSPLIMYIDRLCYKTVPNRYACCVSPWIVEQRWIPQVNCRKTGLCSL